MVFAGVDDIEDIAIEMPSVRKTGLSRFPMDKTRWPLMAL